MRFDVYGRYRLEVVREGETWAVYRVGDGRRRREPGLTVPSSVRAADMATYLDDMLHELARPGDKISRVD